ncbi:PRC-barrel domain-containing protein [Egicoccus sp. AB-alg2]|uniref:PRC-barrel domain-containing protein n=1 Tax=Egicoccus sp. AB-alg2 TaxID=3242693 RepID=UPI00359EFB59
MADDRELLVRIDQRVFDEKGNVVGVVEAVVLTPTLSHMTHVSVSPGGGFTESRLVPIDDLEPTDGSLRLRTDAPWPHGFDRTYDLDFLPLEQDGDYQLPYPYGAEHLLLWDRLETPMGTGTVIRSQLPPGEHELHSGTPVRSADGQRIGHVAGLFLDQATDEVSHVVLRHGHLWERRTVLLPLSLLEGFREGELVVRGTVADLDRYAVS